MKSIRSLSGMPVILSTSGRKIGRVKSVLFDETLSKIVCVCAAGRFGKSVYCPAAKVCFLGEMAVVVSGFQKKKPEGVKFVIRRALDAAGSMIGAVTGLYADEETLSVLYAEVSGGVPEDIARGRKLVRHFAVNADTGDVTMIEEGECEDEEGLGSRYDRGNDRGRFGGDGIRHDELAAGKANGPICDACGQSDLR